MLGQFGGTCLGVMDVVGQLDLREPRQRGGVEIIDGHVVFGHHPAGDFVVFHHIIRLTGRVDLADGNRGRGAPHHGGSAGLEGRHQLGQVLLIIFQRDLMAVGRGVRLVVLTARTELQVVQAEVEVDHVPRAVGRSKPLLQLLDAAAARPGVAGHTVHVGLAGQEPAHLVSIADADRITDDHHPRQLRVVAGRSLARLARIARLGGHERHRREEQGGKEGERELHGVVADRAIDPNPTQSNRQLRPTNCRRGQHNGV